MSWFAATAYCHWLSELQGASGDGKNIFRLPTEKEWEWAAAGREKNGRLRKYPWGDDDPDDKRANYGSNVGHTTPVGSYLAGATPEGLMDMAGNVWEWMENWYNENKPGRALRGGSWNDDSDDRCTIRDWGNPRVRFINVGFRVVRGQLVI